MQKLTPMQAFAVDLLKSVGELHPGLLAYEWTKFKTGREPQPASRRRFGVTSAAYRTLRSLEDLGLVEYSQPDYSYKIKTERHGNAKN